MGCQTSRDQARTRADAARAELERLEATKSRLEQEGKHDEAAEIGRAIALLANNIMVAAATEAPPHATPRLCDA